MAKTQEGTNDANDERWSNLLPGLPISVLDRLYHAGETENGMFIPEAISELNEMYAILKKQYDDVSDKMVVELFVASRA